MKTNWKTLVNPDYLGAYSLDDGNGKYIEIVKTIASVKVENITGADGKKEDCMVMRFADNTKPMIVNVTNAKTLEKLFKSKYIEDWAGRKIIIGVESVKAFGDVVDALRIKKRLPAEPAAAGPAKCADCTNEISAAGEMTAVQVIAFARKRFGADLCSECMKKRDAAKKAAEVAQGAMDATPDSATDSKFEGVNLE